MNEERIFLELKSLWTLKLINKKNTSNLEGDRSETGR